MDEDFPLNSRSVCIMRSSHFSLPLRVSSRFTLDSLLTHRTGSTMLQSETYRCPDFYRYISLYHQGWTSPALSLQSPRTYFIQDAS